MKIAVYAICKNESAFVDRWADSMGEADEIYVLDTGSTDDTVEKLRRRGIFVTQEIIQPWRFDTARNLALALVPEDTDLCVSTDLDEVFRPGWRQLLEQVWTPALQQIYFRYTWNFLPDGSEGYVFWREKIHARHGFRWTHPVHEVLTYQGPGQPRSLCVEGIQLDHHPDPEKSRAQYLPLLELAVAEDPHDDRNRHYLGREYFYRGQWSNCIQTLQSHLRMPESQWADERCASLRYIAKSHQALGHSREALRYLLRACGEAPWLREPWVDLAVDCYQNGRWSGCLFACEQALAITRRPMSYISEADSWGSLPEDLAAIACYHLGQMQDAAAYGREAVKKSPSDERLKENLRWYEQALQG